MSEHQLFLYLVEVVVLVVASRLGGEIALRLGMAQVVGELAFGILLGPSVLGAIWPGGFGALFPADSTQRNLLEITSWIGIVFLVLLSGLEARLGMIRQAGRVVGSAWAGSFFVPFGLGIAFGLAVPTGLVPPGIERGVFALFVATAMSISAIPVIARILMDLGLLRTRIGMLVLSTAVADDTVGWIVLAVVSGLVLRHRFDAPTVLTALAGTAAFLALAFTVGQRLVRKAIVWSERLRIPYAHTTVMLAVVLAGGALTQAIHVHLVLGAFVAGILLARSPRRERESLMAIRGVGMAFFVPFFFAYTGIKVDLTTLKGSTLVVAAVAVVVACVGKFAGAGLGAALGGLQRWEALAVGAGVNARGAMELVIAAVGLSIGVIGLEMYSIIVLIAVLTTLMAAPALRFCLARADPGPPAGTPAASPGSGEAQR